MADAPKRDEFDAFRAQLLEISRLYGGKIDIKEYLGYDGRVMKAILVLKEEKLTGKPTCTSKISLSNAL